MSKKEEKLYMVLDDTVDIGKEPLPVETEKDKEFFEYAKTMKNKYMKNKK